MARAENSRHRGYECPVPPYQPGLLTNAELKGGLRRSIIIIGNESGNLGREKAVSL
jgi:hypothetical protein